MEPVSVTENSQHLTAKHLCVRHFFKHFIIYTKLFNPYRDPKRYSIVLIFRIGTEAEEEDNLPEIMGCRARALNHYPFYVYNRVTI